MAYSESVEICRVNFPLNVSKPKAYKAPVRYSLDKISPVVFRKDRNVVNIRISECLATDILAPEVRNKEKYTYLRLLGNYGVLSLEFSSELLKQKCKLKGSLNLNLFNQNGVRK